MNVNTLDTKKTGLLFFDLLNVYYRGAPEETQKRMKPVVDNAVRLMDAARQASMPIFYAMANHRKDGQIRSMIVTDTDMRLRPWPNDDCNPTVHGATEGSWEQKVIEEIAPRPEDYDHSKISLEHLPSDLFRSGAALPGNRHLDCFRRRRRCRRRVHGIRRARSRL